MPPRVPVSSRRILLPDDLIAHTRVPGNERQAYLRDALSCAAAMSATDVGTPPGAREPSHETLWVQDRACGADGKCGTVGANAAPMASLTQRHSAPLSTHECGLCHLKVATPLWPLWSKLHAPGEAPALVLSRGN